MRRKRIIPIIIVIVVAVLIIGLALYWVASAIRAHDAAQDCIDSGRHDCVALPDR